MKITDVLTEDNKAIFSKIQGLAVWDVVIKNNYYNGKYPDYSGREYRVLASNAEEARKVVLDNADAILKDLLSKKLQSGKKLLPRGAARPIKASEIGEIKQRSQISTTGFITLFSPTGPKSVKLRDGMIEDELEQEVAEDKGKATKWTVCMDVGPHQAIELVVGASSEEEAKSKAMAAAKKQGHHPMMNWARLVTEDFSHDVDHMNGPHGKLKDTNCKTCCGRKVLYKTPDGKKHADNKKGAKKIKCTACKGTGINEGWGAAGQQREHDAYVAAWKALLEKYADNPEVMKHLKSKDLYYNIKPEYAEAKALKAVGLPHDKSKIWEAFGGEINPKYIAKANKERKQKEREAELAARAAAKAANKKTKSTVDYSSLWHEVEDAVGKAVPDVDPMDYILPKLRKYGIDTNGGATKYLDRAAKTAGYKSYDQYLIDMWDAYNEVNGIDEPNPWKAVDETSYYDYHAKDSKGTSTKPERDIKRGYDAHNALGGGRAIDPEIMKSLGIKAEGLDDDQERAGQLGPKVKAKNISPVITNEPKKHPFKGKLVGGDEE